MKKTSQIKSQGRTVQGRLKMPEVNKEGEKAASKGVSVKSGFFGRISFTYEYDGNKTDAPRCCLPCSFEKSFLKGSQSSRLKFSFFDFWIFLDLHAFVEPRQ